MRIVFTSPTGALGGAEFVLLDLLAALRDEAPAHELHLIAATEGPLLARAAALGVKVHSLPMPAAMTRIGDSGIKRTQSLLSVAARTLASVPQTCFYARRLRRLLRTIAPAVIHSNGIKSHLLLALARPKGIPVVWQVQDFAGSRALVSKLLPRSTRGVAAVIAISEAVRRDISTLVGDVPVYTVYDAIDLTKFAPGPGDGAELDRKAGLPPAPGALRFGLVATYAHWKGHFLFLDAAARLTARRPDLNLRFYLIGGPLYTTGGSQFSVEDLRGRIALLRLEDRAGLVPFQPEPVEIFRALDVAVHASTQPEPFGRTIAEAMACGRPVIVSGEGGAVEQFREDHDAVSFRPRDTDSLAAQMEALATDPERRRRLGQMAQCTVRERMSRPRFAREVLAIYSRLK